MTPTLISVVRPRAFAPPRTAVVAVTALAVFAPLLLIFWQSFLNAPFFADAKHVSLDSYAFVFADSDFWNASAAPCSRILALIGSPISWRACLIASTASPSE